MENVAISEATSAFQAVNSKKRSRADMSRRKEQFRSDSVRDTAKQSELLTLKEALKSERESLRRLHRELEEERGASMTAANEAMAMITRLQEEKSAVLVEARRYKLAAEERETHNQEAISLLKEALWTREGDLVALQELLSAYKGRLMTFETEQRQCLDFRGDSDQLLLLEGPNSPLSCMDSNHATFCYEHNQGFDTGAELWARGNECEGLERQDELFGAQCCKDFRHDDNRRQEGNAERDCHTGEMLGKDGIENTPHEQLMFQSNMHCGVHNQESEKLKHSQEQSFDDVSVSIFARVKRLEERFEYLRQNQQAVEHQQPNFTCLSDMVIPDDLKSDRGVKTTWETTSKVPYDRKPGYWMEPEELPAENFASGHRREPEELLKCLLFEKVRLDQKNDAHEQCSPEYHGVAFLENKFSESEDNIGQQKFETTGMDASIFGMPQDVDKDPVEVGLALPNSYAEIEACTAVVAKLSIDVISPLDVKDVRANVSDEDVQQLKLRLQALEGERDFMKEAIDSLRKENKQLKVLQELAQQLRELNIDRRNEVTGQQGHPPLFNFLKGVLSFTGYQSPASTKGNRCLLHACSFSNKQRWMCVILLKSEGELFCKRDLNVQF
ncbi:hypothetical protein GOP47_0016947 [Adiantum capillus-veneris]|uniref:GTD-binding domain-containing protein n=1 Tax=Adiantum capillus-veneris TaxID=13818 RepID=A0A9D4ZC66_ADICA|nr:hypothetical protein GOP47_0016947 [Adiantum capillus-veneris]